MKKYFIKAAIVSLVMMLLTQCNSRLPDTVKLQPNDPFGATVVPSQTFNIDAKQDNVISGVGGTVVVCPKGCFKNSKGEIVTAEVTIELAEALTLSDMLLSNLTATSDGKPLETDGMIFFNATANGEQLAINREIPIHIEIPTDEKKAGMMAYKGIRDANGNMNWLEPKELDHFLVPVDLSMLDFLPSGFQAAVDNGMPYRSYKASTQALTDSLYYSLSSSADRKLMKELEPINYNEPYYDESEKVVDGKYAEESNDAEKDEGQRKDSAMSNCGIDPAIIKVIKSEKYQHTLIATREFEARLRVIFKTCNNSILEIYIRNLDKNLYELDSMAAGAVSDTTLAMDFNNFSKQRLTNVENSDKYAVLLKSYYDEQLSKVKSELEKARQEYSSMVNKKKAEVQKVVAHYQKLLLKREKFRMETYGFQWTETGWINIDNGTLPKTWGPQPLEITVDNGKALDRVYTYVVYKSIKSLYRLNTSDNENFYVGNDNERQMLMPKHSLATGIAIGYKGQTPWIAVREFETTSEPKFSLTLSETTLDSVKQAIRPYESYSAENRIGKDLEFMEKTFKFDQFFSLQEKEYVFIWRLKCVAYPCCYGNESKFPNIK